MLDSVCTGATVYSAEMGYVLLERELIICYILYRVCLFVTA